MKNVLLAAFMLASYNSFSQVNNVTLQASGLTCSMCSNSINKALRTIPYVSEIKSDIKNSSFLISFKEGSHVDFDQLKKKVEDAGFHVAKLTANMSFNNEAIAADQHLQWNGMLLHFLNVKDQVLNGDKTVTILDKGFVTTKEFKKNSTFTKKECYKTGTAAACCSRQGNVAGSRVFHVTI